METLFYIITVVAFILLVYGIYRSGRLDEIERNVKIRKTSEREDYYDTSRVHKNHTQQIINPCQDWQGLVIILSGTSGITRASRTFLSNFSLILVISSEECGFK